MSVQARGVRWIRCPDYASSKAVMMRGSRAALIALAMFAGSAACDAATLHGVTLPVRFDVTRMECGADTSLGHDGCGASVHGRVSRSAFGMPFGYPLVGDEVALDFSIVAIRVHDDGEKEAVQ